MPQLLNIVKGDMFLIGTRPYPIEEYEADPDLWDTKSAEWSACLDDYDLVLEAAAEIVQRPVPRLPYGCRRHFRPEERSEIEVEINFFFRCKAVILATTT
mgnify:CR=1 FL=1